MLLLIFIIVIIVNCLCTLCRVLGYDAVFFNLVFVSNAGAIKVYREFGES